MLGCRDAGTAVEPTPLASKASPAEETKKAREKWLTQLHLELLLLLLLHPAFFSRTTWVSRHQKGKPFWILLEQVMMGWQWHQLDHMQIIYTSLQTNTPAPHHSVFTGRMAFLPPNQQHQSTEGTGSPRKSS